MQRIFSSDPCAVRVLPAELLLKPDVRISFHSPGRSFPDKRQAGIQGLPRRTNPHVVRILGNGERSRRASQEIQVVHVVAWSRNHRVIAAVYENRVAIPCFQGPLPGVLSRVEVLKRKPFRLPDAVIINLIQIDFCGGLCTSCLCGG